MLYWGYWENIDENKFRYALNLMNHRGRDNQTIIKTDFGMFGFNRLNFFYPKSQDKN